MERMNGSVLGLQIDGVYVSCEMSCELNISAEMVPSTNPNGGGWRSFISGFKEWNISLTGNLIKGIPPRDVWYVISALMAGTPVYIDMISDDYTFLMHGVAIPNTTSVTSVSGEVVSYTCTFQGSGEIKNTKLVWSQDGSNAVQGGNDDIVQI